MDARKLRDKLTKQVKNLSGECSKLLEVHLQELNITRQAYHSSCFVGNHIHKMLEVSLLVMVWLSQALCGIHLSFGHDFLSTSVLHRKQASNYSVEQHWLWSLQHRMVRPIWSSRLQQSRRSTLHWCPHLGSATAFTTAWKSLQMKRLIASVRIMLTEFRLII